LAKKGKGWSNSNLHINQIQMGAKNKTYLIKKAEVETSARN
jgi:hypothetical protein